MHICAVFATHCRVHNFRANMHICAFCVTGRGVLRRGVFPEDGCMTIIMNDYDDDDYYDGYDCGDDHNDGDYDDDGVDDRSSKEAMTMTMMTTMTTTATATMVATTIHKNIIISHKTSIQHPMTILEIKI